MSTIQAKRIKQALQKARRVGRIEDSVNIAGCDVVFESLPPEDYEDIYDECSEHSDNEIAYAHTYQIGHLCRSIVEIDGLDLRDVDFIEDDVTTGVVINVHVRDRSLAEKLCAEIEKAGGKATIIPDESTTKTVKIERHEWIKDNVISSWGREAILVGFRKFSELLLQADEHAKEGIKFVIPDETAEDRFRRVLHELQEAENDLPRELTERILDELGYVRKSSLSLDLEGGLLNQNIQLEETETPRAAEPIRPDADALMRDRTPLNREPVAVSTPVAEEQPRKAPLPPPQAVSSKTQQYAMLEAQVDPSIEVPDVGRPIEVAGVAPKVDPEAAKSIIDLPPVVGLNPRFKKRF